MQKCSTITRSGIFGNASLAPVTLTVAYYAIAFDWITFVTGNRLSIVALYNVTVIGAWLLHQGFRDVRQCRNRNWGQIFNNFCMYCIFDYIIFWHTFCHIDSCIGVFQVQFDIVCAVTVISLAPATDCGGATIFNFYTSMRFWIVGIDRRALFGIDAGFRRLLLYNSCNTPRTIACIIAAIAGYRRALETFRRVS